MRKLGIRLKIMVTGFIVGIMVASLFFWLVRDGGLEETSRLAVVVLGVIMFLFGFLMGKETRARRLYRVGWKKGYRDGKTKAALFLPEHPNCRCSTFPHDLPGR